MEMAITVLSCGEIEVIIWLHTEREFADTEWSAAMTQVVEVKQKVKGDVSRIRSLAITDGGAPNSTQRKELMSEVLEGRVKSSAVTTVLNNRIKRGVATAITWLNPNFRAYGPEDFGKALENLDLTPYRAAVLVALKSLHPRLTTKTVEQILEHEASR